MYSKAMMHIVNVPVETRDHWILAIDTSSEQIGVALSDGTATAETCWPAGRQQTTVLLGAIDEVLRRMSIGLTDLTAIAVAIGPGTFNGLRAGLGTAKGLALGSGLPLVGVGTLEATVVPVLIPGRLAVGIVAAGRGRVVSSVFRSPNSPSPVGEGQPVMVGEPHNGSIDDLGHRLAELSGPVTLVGEITDTQVAEMALVLGVTDLWVPPGSARSRRPGGIVALGRARWLAGEIDDPETLDATYLHSAARWVTGSS